MSMNNKDKGSFGAGMFGIALGATLVTIFHEPTRKRVKKTIISFLEDADEKMDNLDSKASKKAKDFQDNARDKLASGLDSAKKKVEKSKKRSR